jgi:hypothetical protein
VRSTEKHSRMAFRNNSRKTDSFFGKRVDEFILSDIEEEVSSSNQLR